MSQKLFFGQHTSQSQLPLYIFRAFFLLFQQGILAQHSHWKQACCQQLENSIHRLQPRSHRDLNKSNHWAKAIAMNPSESLQIRSLALHTVSCMERQRSRLQKEASKVNLLASSEFSSCIQKASKGSLSVPAASLFLRCQNVLPPCPSQIPRPSLADSGEWSSAHPHPRKAGT